MVTRCITNPNADSLSLQQDLQVIYRWAEKVNMVFNGDKFVVLHFWRGKVPKPTTQYKDPDGILIEETWVSKSLVI